MVTSYGIFHFYDTYFSFKLVYFPLVSSGGLQGWVVCRDGILHISGGSQQATHRQRVLVDACTREGISMFPGPPKVVWYHLVPV